MVADAGREAFGEETLLKGPLLVDAVFYLPRPKSHYRTGKHSDELKENAPYWHFIKRYDREKLARAVFDSLTHVIWEDDGQVCTGSISKLYDDRPGVLVVIHPLPDPSAATPAF